VRAAILSPHRQCIEHYCRKRAGHFRLEEDVARGDWEGVFAMAGRERCSKSQCVKVTAMIRCEDERPLRWQLLTADDRQSVCDREVTSQQRKTSMMREPFEKSAFACTLRNRSLGVRPVSWAGRRFQGSIRFVSR